MVMIDLLGWWNMSHIKNKVKWCFKKANKELLEKGYHKGLIHIESNMELARKHLIKSEHNLEAITRFKKIGFSDWSAPAAFYSVYHALLAILAKFGYESRNQECTFAMIYSLIEDKKINLSKELLFEINALNLDGHQESPRLIEIRELKQYGVSISLDEHSYNRLKRLSRSFLDQVKEIIEE